MIDDLIFHLVPKRNWDKWHQGSYYVPPILEKEGTIPCSTGEQLSETANRLFQGERRLNVLVIDTSMVQADVIYQKAMSNNAGDENLYPHIKGKLNIDSIIDKIRIYPNKEGYFDLKFTSEE